MCVWLCPHIIKGQQPPKNRHLLSKEPGKHGEQTNGKFEFFLVFLRKGGPFTPPHTPLKTTIQFNNSVRRGRCKFYTSVQTSSNSP